MQLGNVFILQDVVLSANFELFVLHRTFICILLNHRWAEVEERHQPLLVWISTNVVSSRHNSSCQKFLGQIEDTFVLNPRRERSLPFFAKLLMQLHLN